MPKEYQELEDEEESFPDEEVVEEEEPTPAVKKKKVVRPTNWQIQHIPEVFRVIDPKNKTLIAEATSIEELKLQLEVITVQHAVEGAKNTR